jgi:hypothetical protein
LTAGLALGVAGAAAVVVMGAAQSRDSRPEAAPPASTTEGSRDTAPSGSDHWLRELERLDRLRAKAWTTGTPRGLRRVYAPDSAVLRADRRMLRTYISRGLRTDGVRLEFAMVRVVDRRPREVELAVVDRLGPVRVHTDIGGAASLPADQPTAHTIVLRRVGGQWLIAAVRARSLG